MSVVERLCALVDGLNERIGRAVAWTALLMVLVQLVIVVLRYVFGVGFIWLQESVIYLFAAQLMLGAGYTLLRGGHVRIDVFYGRAGRRTRAWIDLLGTLAFLMPMCGLILWVSWPYVVTSWTVFESSRETSGIPAVFLLKTLIIAFGVLVILQGMAVAGRGLMTVMGRAPPAAPPDEGHTQ